MKKALFILSTFLMIIHGYVVVLAFSGDLNPEKSHLAFLVAGITASGIWFAFILHLFLLKKTHPQETSSVEEDKQQVQQAAGSLLKIVGHVNSSLSRTDSNAETFEKDMHTHEEKIKKAGSIDDFKQGIQFAISEIRKVISLNSKLRNELKSANVRLSKQQSAIERLRIETLKDPLTRLYNRRALDEFIKQSHLKLKEEGVPVSVIMLDIDRFKQINDEYTHAYGDIVLKKIARTLSDNVEEGGFCIRYGGEEFCIIIEYMNLRQAYEYAEDLRKKIDSEPVTAEKTQIHVQISGGVAAMRSDEAPGDTVSRADRALYEAKKQGRNKVRVDVDDK